MLMTLRGRKVRYDLVGPEHGPIVCLAHSLSADSGVWVEQLPALLAAGWRVLCLDMRGHGGSAAVDGDCTMRDLARDVVEALDALQVAKAHFVGLSIGGMIGQTLAIHHADRLESLMLSGTSPAAVPGGMAMWDARFAAIDAAGSLEPLADDTMQRWFTDGFRARRPDRWEQVRNTVAGNSPAGYVSGARAIIAFDVRERLAGVRTPTLVVCGDEDVGTPPEGNRLIAELIPGARYQEIASARHIPMVEHPETYNKILLGWLGSRL